MMQRSRFTVLRSVSVLTACSLAWGVLSYRCPEKFLPEQVLAAESETASPQAVFSTTAPQIGAPLEVTLKGISVSQCTYTWYIDGKKISCNTASYTPTEDDLEKMISVTVQTDSGAYSCSMYFSTLPVVYIDTDGGQEITSKEEYIGASCRIQGNGEFSDASLLYDGAAEIRGRGNYTWEHEKKPYKLKLDSKADLFGLGENKHWVLIAEYMDPTHLRNEIMPEISETLGMEYTADGEAVVLVLNGSYNGLYHFSENVRIDSNRVNVYDWEETAEDIAKAVYKKKKSGGMTKDDRDELEDKLVQDLTWVSTGTFTWQEESYTVSDYVTLPEGIDGGYLLELDTYDDYHTKQVSDFTTDGDQPIQFKSPEYAVTNDSMYQYAVDYIQSFENAVQSDDYYAEYNGLDKHYSELFDMDSLVQYWLMLELSANSDGMRFSNYMYKDFGELFKMGPAWDYDWTWNIGYTVPEEEWWKDQDFYNDSEHWYKNLTKDPYFITKAYELYISKKTALSEIYTDGGRIDACAEELAVPAKADLAKWKSGTDYDSEVQDTKSYVRNRFTWMEQQFSSVESLAQSLGYESSDKLKVTEIQGTENGRLTLTAQVTDDAAETVTFHINGKYAGSAAVTDGQAVLEVSANCLEQDRTALNTVQIRMQDADGNYLKNESSAGSDSWNNWGWNNSWEQDTAEENQVYSSFVTFTAEEIGAVVSVRGDVNADGEFNAADVVMMQKWLTDVPDTKLADWQAGNLYEDDILNAFDLCLMKRLLIYGEN